MTNDLIKAAPTAESEVLVPVDSDRHPNMFKTLDLLSLAIEGGKKIYFVVEGCATFCSVDELRQNHRYLYEEHTCPTNFIRIEAIFFDGDDDCHGLFEHIDSAWMTSAYVEARGHGEETDYLATIFKELRP